MLFTVADADTRLHQDAQISLVQCDVAPVLLSRLSISQGLAEAGYFTSMTLCLLYESEPLGYDLGFCSLFF